ncbi:MAG: hypothetical protein V3S56_03170, partial [Gemmatimonadota bacterium]
GNALAGAGQIGPAIAAFEQALEMDPEHEDARYNRDLLLQQPEQNQSDEGDSDGEESGESEDGDSQQPSEGEPTEDDPSEDSRMSDQEQEAQPSAAEEALAEQAQDIPQGELPTADELEEWADEQAAEQWLRRIPQDPGGLLRRKFLYQYQRLGIDQDGNYVWPGDEQQPW